MPNIKEIELRTKICEIIQDIENMDIKKEYDIIISQYLKTIADLRYENNIFRNKKADETIYDALYRERIKKLLIEIKKLKYNISDLEIERERFISWKFWNYIRFHKWISLFWIQITKDWFELTKKKKILNNEDGFVITKEEKEFNNFVDYPIEIYKTEDDVLNSEKL